MRTLRQYILSLREDGVATNCAGGGAIAGIGIGPSGEPGMPRRKKKLGPLLFKKPLSRKRGNE